MANTVPQHTHQVDTGLVITNIPNPLPVEVTNDPLPVKVTNPTTIADPLPVFCISGVGTTGQTAAGTTQTVIGVTTTVAAGSNSVNLNTIPASMTTIFVASTTHLLAFGTVNIVVPGSPGPGPCDSWQVNYTGLGSGTLTGCTNPPGAPFGSAVLATGQLVFGPVANRTAFTVHNLAAATQSVFIGPDGVTDATGYAVEPGHSQTFSSGIQWYAIAAATGTTVSWIDE